MRRIKKLTPIFICSLLLNHAYANTTNMTPPINQPSFNQLADQYFDEYYFPYQPTTATSYGIHDYDSKLEDYSKKGIQERIKLLKIHEARFEAISPITLDEQSAGDRELILGNIRSQLLTLQSIKPHEKNPDIYPSGITNSAFVIMSRKFAPADERLKSLIEREKQMPKALLEAKKNIKNPPKIYTEIAIEQLPGTIKFFEKDVPSAFTEVNDEQLKQEFTKTNDAVIAALKEYQTWLTKQVLNKSHGDFRIGWIAFKKKLKYDEMVNEPLEKLIQIDMKNMRQNQKDFVELAKEIDPNKTPEEILAEHPEPNKLLTTFSDHFDALINFIKDKKIITIPSDVKPTMEETPPFLRAITFASMDTPGPFEKIAKEAFFNVTLPEASWSKEDTEQFMHSFNNSTISSIAIHETYPGHYVQFLWMHNINDRTRKILGAATNSEGWAHYAEQMMLDEGYGGINTREAKILRLGQLQEALLRNARFVVGIKMHTGQMTFDQAVEFFINEGKQSRKVATTETKRGTSDPTYLYYTLGKLEILKLRADIEKKEGAQFNLQQFHDNFMRQGFAPIKIVRKAMLHDDSPVI